MEMAGGPRKMIFSTLARAQVKRRLDSKEKKIITVSMQDQQIQLWWWLEGTVFDQQPSTHTDMSWRAWHTIFVCEGLQDSLL